VEVVVKKWTDCIARSTRAAWAWRRLGQHALNQAGQEEEAVRCYQYAVKVVEEDVDAWVGLARAYRKLSRGAASLKAYRKALTLPGAGASVQAELGMAQCEVGMVDEAVVNLRASLQEGDLLVQKALAEALLAQACARLAEGFHGRAGEALKEGTKVLTVVPEAEWPVCVWKLLGDMHTLAFLLPPDGWDDQGGLQAFVAKGEEAYKSILNLEPNSAATYYDIGLNVYGQARLAKLAAGEGSGVSQSAAQSGNDLLARSAAMFARAVELDPLYSPAWVGMGCTESKRALVRQHCFIRAIQLDHNANAWANLGILYGRMGRPDLAREAFRGLQLVQEHPMMWVGLGLLLEIEGEAEIGTAVNAYRAALEVSKG